MGGISMQSLRAAGMVWSSFSHWRKRNSKEKLYWVEDKKNGLQTQWICKPFCDSDRIQTCNLLIRSQMLYSVELRSRSCFDFVCKGMAFYLNLQILKVFFIIKSLSFSGDSDFILLILAVASMLGYWIKSMLRFTKLLKASPVSIPFCSNAKSISWCTFLLSLP